MATKNSTPRTSSTRNPNGQAEPKRRKNKDGTVVWTVQVGPAGFKRVAKSFPDKGSAIRWRDELVATLRKEKKRGAVKPDLATFTLGKLILDFLADPRTAQLSAAYFEELHRLLAWWTQEYGSIPVLEFGVFHWRAGRDKLLVGKRKAGTVNRYVRALTSTWNWGRAGGLIPNEHVVPPRIMLKEPRGRVRFLSEAELPALLKAVKEHSQTMLTAVLVSTATGMRQGELLRLNWNDVNFEKKTLTVHFSKNEDPRQVFLTDIALTALRNMTDPKVRSIAGPVFVTGSGVRIKKSVLQNRWRKLKRKVGLVDFKWHDLRHTFASYLAQNSANLLQIGAAIGHRSVASTQRYAHLVQGAPLPAHSGLEKKLDDAS